MRLAVTSFLRENAFPIGLFLFLRVWTMFWASVAVLYVPLSAANQYFGVEPLHDLFFAPWQRWDTIWYTKIAIEGYAANQSVNFAPLYPFLIRLFMPVTGNNAVAAGLWISSAAALVSFVLLYHLACAMFGKGAARRAVLFLGVFPTAFFLFAAYTEPLFLALALGAFLCALRSRWGWAGILGAFVAMTRPQGVLFFLPMAVEFWDQYRHDRISLSRAWTLLPVLVGGAAQLLWLTYQFGTPAVWFQGQALLHHAVLPWDVLAAGWGAVLNATSLPEAALSLLDPISSVCLLAALVWSARRLAHSMTVYIAIIVAPSLFIVTTYSDAYPLTSVSRFFILAFPVFLLLGSLPSRWWETVVLTCSFFMQTLLLILFAAWVFVR